MDYRQKAFNRKFQSASEYLLTSPDRIISIKVRESVSDSYRELFDDLEHLMPIRRITGDFDGNAYLIDLTDEKTIVVEHETGLEILYIAASIASLIGLIPLILQTWSRIRGRGRHRLDRGEIEVRYLDENGGLVERRLHNVFPALMASGDWEHDYFDPENTRRSERYFKGRRDKDLETQRRIQNMEERILDLERIVEEIRSEIHQGDKDA